MQQPESSPNSERRSFAIHSAIIKTLINEQAGSLTKAVAELVMNAVDAGASELSITVCENGEFTIRDNGRGFTSRDEIEQFFETFGTPHADGDAHYGRFRIGRGQIMSYAKTVWHSGRFEMRVDLEREEQFFGYELIEHVEESPGCTISGHIYRNDPWRTSQELIGMSEWGEQSNLSEMIRFVPIPVLVNGIQINTTPSTQKWDLEDDYAWYNFDTKAFHLQIFNRGVHVCDRATRDYGIGGVVTTKQPLHVNLARNSVITHNCGTWTAIADAIRSRFSLQLGRVKKLNDSEAARLLRDLLFGENDVPYETQRKVRNIRFIPDVFGELKTPNDILTQERFTMFDGEHMGIAERVHREGLATVIMPELLRRARAEVSEKNAQQVILTLRRRLELAEHSHCTFIPFEQLVRDLSDTSSVVPDKELSPEELMVMKLLRAMNGHIACMTNGKSCTTRLLVAGVSDCMEGWTDGSTYIAINRKLLNGIRGQVAGGSPAKLITLLIHEYAHRDLTLGEHHHDREFYARYHEATLHRDFGLMIDKLFRKYITGIAKLQVVPSGEHRAHLKTLSRDMGRLRSRYNGASE